MLLRPSSPPRPTSVAVQAIGLDTGVDAVDVCADTGFSDFLSWFYKSSRVRPRGHLPSILPTAWFFILERSRLRYTKEGARLYCPSDPVLAAQYLLAVSRMQIAAALSWAPAPQCDVRLYAALVTLLIRQRPSSGAARESISNSLVCVCTRDT
eukprot:scaffold131975_cov75-Phaeocystis_antarctica.AAC.1